MTRAEQLHWEFIETVLMYVLYIVIPSCVQLVWRRRLPRRRAERIWIREQWALLIWAFGFWTMLPFAWITRKNSSLGSAGAALGRGVLGVLFCGALTYAILYGFETAVGMPEDDAAISPSDVPSARP